MHGQKKRRKRSMTGTFEIDGLTLVWELMSEPQWTTEGAKGLCVCVRLSQGSNRELNIEFPYDKTAYVPQRPKLSNAIVETEARLAMTDGWNPESRGKAYSYNATTTLELGQQRPGNLSYLLKQPSAKAEEQDKANQGVTGEL